MISGRLAARADSNSARLVARRISHVTSSCASASLTNSASRSLSSTCRILNGALDSDPFISGALFDFVEVIARCGFRLWTGRRSLCLQKLLKGAGNEIEIFALRENIVRA